VFTASGTSGSSTYVWKQYVHLEGIFFPDDSTKNIIYILPSLEDGGLIDKNPLALSRTKKEKHQQKKSESQIIPH
jgi:hypothetical protein